MVLKCHTCVQCTSYTEVLHLGLRWGGGGGTQGGCNIHRLEEEVDKLSDSVKLVKLQPGVEWKLVQKKT